MNKSTTIIFKMAVSKIDSHFEYNYSHVSSPLCTAGS